MAFTITIDQATACLDMDFTNSIDCTIDFGAFDTEVNGNFTATANLTVVCGTSLINMLGNTKTFTGAGKTYYDLSFSGTPITVVGDNTFNNLYHQVEDNIVKFTAGSAQTIVDLVGTGSLGHEIVIESTAGGSEFFLLKSAGSITVNFWSIKDSNAGGGATFTATNSIDVSGNTGWIFNLPDIIKIAPNYITADNAKIIVPYRFVVDNTLILKILEYRGDIIAQATTDGSNIVYGNHGVKKDDMIVNTTRRTAITSERGSRIVLATGLTDNNIPLESAITSQVAGDNIKVFTYIDRTYLLKVMSMSFIRATANMSQASFTLITDVTFIPICGQYVRFDYKHYGIQGYLFSGVITGMNKVKLNEYTGKLLITCQCVGWSQIPSRRTIRINYEENGTLNMGDIVTDLVTNYLNQDGIRIGTIENGVILQDDWVDDAISISEVLDECAARSGYQWYIDNDGLLTFNQDPVSIDDSLYDIVDGGAFTDFRKVSINDTIDGYSNKIFLTGGSDSSGDQVIISATNEDEQNARQDIQGGTGTYGSIIRDATVNDSFKATAGASTTTTNIHIVGHGQEVGWTVLNLTRSSGSTLIYTRVLAIINDDNFTCDLVTGQTSGDTIVLFDGANVVIANSLKKESVLPSFIQFETGTLGFLPNTKMLVNLAEFGIINKYYLIESVEYFDINGLNIHCRIKAVERRNSAFSTQRSTNYIDFFGGF